LNNIFLHFFQKDVYAGKIKEKGGQSKIKSKEDDSGNETEDRYFHLMPNFVTDKECVRVRESWRSKGPCAPFDK
jgi:hypothetical protein